MFNFGTHEMNLSKLLFIHVYKDKNVVAQLVRRAERAIFKAIALMVDNLSAGAQRS